jgi:hypothetical protein
MHTRLAHGPTNQERANVSMYRQLETHPEMGLKRTYLVDCICTALLHLFNVRMIALECVHRRMCDVSRG